MNVNKNSIDEWLNSDYLSQVRESFSKDERHPGCSECWKKEDVGFISMRHRTAREYEILKIDTEQKQIKNVEIALGNLCNLKCLMCNEQDSSSFLAENKQLGINLVEQKDIA